MALDLNNVWPFNSFDATDPEWTDRVNDAVDPDTVNDALDADAVDALLDGTKAGFVAALAAAGPYVAADYAPALTNGTNVASSTLVDARYTRVDNTVTVFARVTATPTAGSDAASVLDIALPVASNLAAVGDLIGMAVNYEDARMGFVEGNATDNRASLNFLATDTNEHTFHVTFSYIVI